MILKRKDYLTTSQVADLLCVSKATIKNWDNNGVLRADFHTETNNTRLYKQDTIDNFIKTKLEPAY